VGLLNWLQFVIIPIIGNFEKILRVMNRNTSISLGSHFDNFIQSRISKGRFKNASEVVRAGLRLLEEEENKTIALREAILEGIDSGIDNDFEPKAHLEKLKANKNMDGKIYINQ
jgi:antitoxin ParD1/3/4